MASLTLGSLFSGIGGFELVGTYYDIKPVWASEINKNCIKITSNHFPTLKHLGDVSKIRGYDIEPVDIISSGSPCTDLSYAGKCRGINPICKKCGTTINSNVSRSMYESIHCSTCNTLINLTESGLFYDFIRIVQEMRDVTNECYPKIVVWENVRAALTSNQGDDFFCVLQECCKLLGERIPELRPEKWAYAGEILAKKGSVAWRCLNAEYWGVPQRRNRIFLVIDFTGGRAKEILFNPESMRGHSSSGRNSWERFTTKANRCNKSIYVAGMAYKAGGKNPHFAFEADKSPTLVGNQTLGLLIDDNIKSILRNATPVEYERLQGFPDNWTEGISDTARYKALGNSVALPCVDYIFSGIADVLYNRKESKENE